MPVMKDENRPLRVGMISLGCAKNLVDAEVMLGALLKDGIEITNDPAKADAVLINTCSFIDSAQEESVDTILESVQVREAGLRGQALIVAGCLSQRFRDELPKLLPEVDAFMGIDQVARVGAIVREALDRRSRRLADPAATSRAAGKRRVMEKLGAFDAKKPADTGPNLRAAGVFGRTKTVLPSKPSGPLFDVTARPTYVPDYQTPRFRLTPRHFAYLKIAEGCNHPCSFCIIPAMRGSHRSRAQQDVVAEARALLADGVKEINLISQDSTYYGLDLRPNHSRAIAAPARFKAAVSSLSAGATTISTLLRELNGLPGDFWVRLLYTHPAHWTDELIAAIAECPKVARYVDIPLQHIHENMLERMRRETSRQYIEDLLTRIRAGVPGIALRTTFIVGFPGETEECFESLLEFIRKTRFERLGVFAYSREEGTRAGAMAGQVPAKVRLRRRDQAMALQRQISAEIMRGHSGMRYRVLVEMEAKTKTAQVGGGVSWEHGLIREGISSVPRTSGTVYSARGQADAPDIDGRVYVTGRCKPGEFATVEVTGHTDYDLFAKVT